MGGSEPLLNKCLRHQIPVSVLATGVMLLRFWQVSDVVQEWGQQNRSQGFAVTDTTCQKPQHTETFVTGNCSGSNMVEFAGDGPGAYFETFSTTTCDPGTSNGGHQAMKLDTCRMGSGESSKLVCASGKVKTYKYWSSGNCVSGGELLNEVAVGECHEGPDGIGLLLKSAC